MGTLVLAGFAVLLTEVPFLFGPAEYFSLMVLGLILGPMMEENLRRALLLSRGDWTVFLTRCLSASLLAIAVLLLVIVLSPAVRKKREEAFVED